MLRALLGLLLLALPALAQEGPACTTAREGATACLAGKLCTCRFERGGSITGRADGHRWDCGALRPACGEALPPAGLGQVPDYPLPGLLLQMPQQQNPGGPQPYPPQPYSRAPVYR